MRIHINKSNEHIVQTPFGNFEITILKQILPKIGIKWNEENDSWVFVSENTNKKDEKSGKDLWLPIRAMNFEIALHKAKKETYTDEEWRVLEARQDGNKLVRAKDPSLTEIKRALSYGYENKYLPALQSEKSYGALYRKYGLD